MRFIPLLIAGVAGQAAAAEPAPPAALQPSPQEVAEVQKALGDPATGAALGRVTGVLSKALMNLPVGELEAAIDGRAPTAADRQRTVRDSIGSPEEAARIERGIAASGPQMDAMRRAIVSALPGMIAAAGEMQRAIGEAGAGLPRQDDGRR